MLNLAQVGSILCVVSLVLAFNGRVADAGLSANCVATDGGTTSLLLQVKKNKKHKNGSEQSHDDSGLTECTIQSAGGGGGCKSGFNYKCEKMKSGKKCCGCVAAKGIDDPQPEKGTQAKTQVDTQNKAEERFSVGTDAQGGENTPGGTLILPQFESKP